MGAPSYAGAAAARGKMLNARGSSSPIVAKTLRIPEPGPQTVIGSQSYNYAIPILNLPGRAGLDLTLNLYYNSRVWNVDNVGNSVTFNADRDFPSYGFRLDFGYVEINSLGGGGSITVTENDGTKHLLVQSDTSTDVYDANDGTYLEYTRSMNRLMYRNGTSIFYEPFSSQAGQQHPLLYRPNLIQDANGNKFFLAYLSGHDDFLQTIGDVLGRFIHFNYDANAKLTSITQNVPISSVDPTGVHTYATFTWGNPYSANQTWYSFSPTFSVNNAPAPENINVLTDCTYANGTGYHFTYGDWGIIKKIENLSSTGSTRSYVSYNFPAASAGALTDAPAYTQQTLSPDGLSTNTSVWSYAVTKSGTGVVTSMVVTDPLGNSSTTNLDQNTGLTSSVQLKDSSNTLLRTISYTWAPGLPLPASITTTLNDTGQQSAVQYVYDGISNVGNPTDVYEYDFGMTLKRHTVTTYQNGTNLNFNYHILTLPTRVVVKDGAGNTISRTDMAYDGTSLVSVTGDGNHDDVNYGSGFTIRGNLTSVTRYTNAAAGTLPVTRTFTYDTLGNLRTAQLDCCNSKTFNFSSGTHYAYPDSVVRGPSGLQFTSSFTYDYDKGLLLTSTDENGQQTQYQYDSMNRTTLVSLPPQNSTVVQMKTEFDDAAAAPTVKSSSINSGNTGVSLTTLDGLGHVMQVDNKDGSTIISSVKSVYDKLWRRTQVSNPYAPGDTPIYTNFAYDGLGRLTRVTPPSAGYTQYTYSGNAVTVTDPAGKQRKNYTDALGRLIEVDEPGWGDALKSSGSVTIGGADASVTVDPCYTQYFSPPPSCPRTIWDSGSVSITVNGHIDSTSYGASDTASTVAARLATAINNDSSAAVTAALSGAIITLASKVAGASTNYSLSASSSTNDVPDFGGPSFSASPSGPTLTGGLDGTPEGSPTLARPIVTTYGYDLLDRLISASVAAMGPVNGATYTGQPRSYVYDGLGRLTSATTPESGTVTNFYTTSGGATCANDPSLPCRVQDARGVVKTLTYDNINRPLSVSYSDTTPSVSYTYDAGGATAFALGRLTSITEGGNLQTLTYDNLGRITSANQTIDSVSYPLQYTYNLLGQLATITYPSTHVVTQSYDAIGRMASIANGGTAYLSGLSYNAAGETLGLTMGNGVQGAFTYNDHLQLQSLRYFKSGITPDPLNLGYDYTSATQPNNNGQIQAMHYYTQPGTEDTNKSESFTYDSWFRLKAAQTVNVNVNTPGTWSLAWTYDRLGNRKQQTLTGGNLPGGIGQPNFTIDETTNRISSFTYDSAGNLTGDGAFTYAYDGANRMKQAQQVAAPNTVTSSTYFGPLRIKKVVGSTTTLYLYSGSKLIAEYVNGSLSKEYIYAGSALLATVAGTSTTYHHADLLSNRAETDATGAVARTFGHFPYGESWYESASDPMKFTTYSRDSGTGETGLDYAMFRQYNSGQARFMSADLLSGNIGSPQSLNRYSYTGNDPINGVDPLGLDTLCATPFITTEWSDHHKETLFGAAVCVYWDPFFTGVAGSAPAPVPGGGGKETTFEKKLNKRFLEYLTACIKELYNIELTAFQASSFGSNGFFEGKDAKGQITVINDVGSYSITAIRIIARDFSAVGWTPLSTARNQTNYTGRDLDQDLFRPIQVHELAHSLDQITSGSIFGSSEKSADRLQDCISKKQTDSPKGP
jgi:RHS repeat-associated protein